MKLLLTWFGNASLKDFDDNCQYIYDKVFVRMHLFVGNHLNTVLSFVGTAGQTIIYLCNCMPKGLSMNSIDFLQSQQK